MIKKSKDNNFAATSRRFLSSPSQKKRFVIPGRAACLRQWSIFRNKLALPAHKSLLSQDKIYIIRAWH